MRGGGRNKRSREQREARARPVVSVNGAARAGSSGRISLFNSRIV